MTGLSERIRRKMCGKEENLTGSGGAFRNVEKEALVKGLGPAAADPSKLEIRHILVP